MIQFLVLAHLISIAQAPSLDAENFAVCSGKVKFKKFSKLWIFLRLFNRAYESRFLVICSCAWYSNYPLFLIMIRLLKMLENVLHAFTSQSPSAIALFRLNYSFLVVHSLGILKITDHAFIIIITIIFAPNLYYTIF